MGLEKPLVLIALMAAAGFIFFFLKTRTKVGFPALKNLPKNPAAGAVTIMTEFALPVLIIVTLAMLASGFFFPAKEIIRYGYGSDIVVVLDESGSMNDTFSGEKIIPENLPGEPGSPTDPNATTPPEKKKMGKIDAAKKIIRPFIAGRKDRLGLVVFGSSTAPISPLSFNHEGFLHCFDAQTAPLQGTLLDRGLAQALQMLSESTAKTKIILLISDGQGGIDDEKYQLSALINAMGIRVYWVAIDHLVGWYNGADHPMIAFGHKLNPAMFKTIPATDSAGLETAFQEIDRQERSLIAYKEKVGEGGLSMILAWIPLISAAIFFCLRSIHND